MAFTQATLGVIVQPIGGDGMRFISYRTDDAQATVTATDYFADAGQYGIRTNDLIFVSPISASFDPYILTVDAVDAEGNVTAVVAAEDIPDDKFFIVDNIDTTKKLAFQVSGISTATTRTATWPDADLTVVGTATTQTLTNKSLVDASTSFIDDADATKVVKFQLSGLTTATTRTVTWPDADLTVVGTGTTQTLTNKSLVDASTSFVDDADATKVMQFQLSSITTGTTRTVTWPDANVTFGTTGLALLADALPADARNELDTAPYIATRTALKALDTTKDTVAILTESGRDGVFVWRTGNYSSQITADTQEGIYLKADAIASTAGAWVRQGIWLFSGVSVGWFGAVGDGTADDTAAIQAAIDLIETVTSGGKVLFGIATYKITAALSTSVSGTTLEGASRDKSIIRQDTLNANVVNLAANFNALRGLKILYGGTPTGGTAVAVTGSYVTLTDFVINSAYEAISVAQVAAKITEFEIFNYENIGIRVQGTNDTFISKFIISAGNTTRGVLGGIRLADKAEAVIVCDGDILQGAYSMTIDAATNSFGSRPAYCRFSNVYFDSAVNPVTLNNLTDFSFLGCWFSERATGCRLDTVDGVVFEGCTFANNSQHGCHVTAAAKRVTFSGSKFIANSTDAAGTYHGLVVAAGATDFVVQGCTATNGLGFSGTQGYGIAVLAGASDRYVITDNLVTGNSTGGISDGGTGSDKHIAGNIGYVTQNRGSATITSGTTSVVVNHGLAGTPNHGDVIVTPVNSLGSATKFWVASYTATQFTISVNVDPAADASFAWSARVKGA